MNSKGQDERQQDHRQQRTEEELNLSGPAKRGPIRGRTVFVIILVVLLLSVTAWYLAMKRQVVILTDPVWKSTYLEPEHTAEQLKINLLNHFYIPRIVNIPFEQAAQAELEAICRSREGAWFLLSPYLSSLIEPAKLLQACSGSNLVVWETEQLSRTVSQDALSSTLPSDPSSEPPSKTSPKLSSSETLSDSSSEPAPELPSQLTVLYFDPQRVARAMAEGLEPLLSAADSTASTTVATTESNRQPIQLVWSRDGHFSEDFALAVQAELSAQLPALDVKLVHMGEQGKNPLNSAGATGEGSRLEIASEAVIAILDGEPNALQELLTRIENRGARAVVFGAGALSGWPTGVEAEISIDIKTTFNELIKPAAKPAAKPAIKTPEQASMGRFAVRFQVKR
ncbi:MAG: hypothetical protein K9M94_13105 [Spirochaetia bacterium]|nr:hypothetical protein [Spirochaetia bacterium]